MYVASAEVNKIAAVKIKLVHIKIKLIYIIYYVAS